MIQDLSSAIGRVRAGVVMKKQNLGTQFSPTLVADEFQLVCGFPPTKT
jgi:hypothetical protein